MIANKLGKILSLSSAVYLAVFSIFLVVLGWINPFLEENDLLIFSLVYCCGLIPFAFAASVWLLWRNRRQLSRTWVWLAFQLVFTVSMSMYSLPVVGLFFASLLFLLTPLLGLINFLYAIQKEVSLRLIGWGSFGWIWAMFIILRINENLFDELIASMAPNSPNNLWWFGVLMYGFGWIVIAGVLAFIVETFQILRREYVGMAEDEKISTLPGNKPA